MKRLRSALLLSVLALSMFAFTQVMLVQAEATTAGAGWHEMTAVYYKAYIYDDHDAWPKGAGEWYFGLLADGWWTISGEYSRDGPGWVDFADRIRIWNIQGSTYFKCEAREHDTGGWDYISTLQVNVGLGSFNVWHYGNYKVGDVNHYYKYKIENRNPTVGAISGASSGYRKVAYTWTATGSDPDGDSITYYWYVDGVLKKTGTSSFTYTFPTSAALGAHNITVKTKDYFGLYSSYSSKTFTINNRAPTVGAISGPSSGYRKVHYTWSTTGGDPDGDAITYYWYVDGSWKAMGGPGFGYTFPTGAALGVHIIQVRTRDSFGLYSSYSSKTFTINNRAPTVGPISGPSSGDAGVPYTYSTSGADPDGDPITYQWQVNAVTQPATGPSMTYTFPAAGTYTVRVRTKDSHGMYSSYSSKTVTITAVASFKIWADKTSYHIGETMKVYVRVKNPGSALPVRALIYLRLPDGTRYGPLLNMVVTIPAGYDSGNVLWNSFTIPPAPLGNYAWIAELKDPGTGTLISQDMWNWQLLS